MLGELNAEEIEEVLHSEVIGRIGCVSDGWPYVVPVSYAYDGESIYAHSAEGLKISAMRDSPRVCFEVERIESMKKWRTVIARGQFEPVWRDDEERAMDLLGRASCVHDAERCVARRSARGRAPSRRRLATGPLSNPIGNEDRSFRTGLRRNRFAAGTARDASAAPLRTIFARPFAPIGPADKNPFSRFTQPVQDSRSVVQDLMPSSDATADPIRDATAILSELAFDLRSSWNHQADDLWIAIDADLWRATANPWLVWQAASRERLEELWTIPAFRERALALRERRQRDRSDAAWFQRAHPGDGFVAAFFSLEFAVAETLPLYSGGLGNVAGDYLKSASDLGVPLVGVGLLYQQGYFPPNDRCRRGSA